MPTPGKRREDPLRTVHSLDPQEIRREVFRRVLDLADADFAGFFCLSQVEGQFFVSDWQFEHDGGAGARVFREAANRPYPGVHYLRIRHPEPRSLRSFLETSAVADLRELESSEVYDKVLRPLKFGDQLRLLVYHGARFVGSVIAVRRIGSKPFTRKDRRRMSTLVEGTVSAMTAADDLARTGTPERGAHLLVRPDGIVEYASDGLTRAWLENSNFVDALRQAVRDFDSGRGHIWPIPFRRAQVRLSRLDGPEGVRYFANLLPAPNAVRSSLPELSPRQEVVAGLAAAGATIAEIAIHLGKSPNTIQTQLRQIYQKLEISSRVELARALEELR